jgi:anti-sigma-K factor RskA
VLAHAAFTVLASVAAAIVALNVVAWSGTFADEQERAPATAADAALTRTATDVATLVERRAQSKPVAVVVTARRGPCWLSVRRDSPQGERLYLGILARGRTLELSGARIWMRVGAGENLVVRVNGRRVGGFPEGIAEVALTADGLRRV